MPESIIKLYKYIENERADSDLTKRIDAAVKKGRKNEMWRSQYIKEQNILRDAREDGKEEGREEGRVLVVTALPHPISCDCFLLYILL